MPDWLWYAAFGFNLGSGLTWWAHMVRLSRRDRARWEHWRQREEDQSARWAHVARCSACMTWLNEDNARLAARGLHDNA